MILTVWTPDEPIVAQFRVWKTSVPKTALMGGRYVTQSACANLRLSECEHSVTEEDHIGGFAGNLTFGKSESDVGSDGSQKHRGRLKFMLYHP
jgi:hypothetical protein